VYTALGREGGRALVLLYVHLRDYVCILSKDDDSRITCAEISKKAAPGFNSQGHCHNRRDCPLVYCSSFLGLRTRSELR